MKTIIKCYNKKCNRFDIEEQNNCKTVVYVQNCNFFVEQEKILNLYDMNYLREEFEKETGTSWINSQGEPDLDYVIWLEEKIKTKDTMDLYLRPVKNFSTPEQKKRLQEEIDKLEKKH